MAEIRIRSSREERFVCNCPHFDQGFCEKLSKRCAHIGPLYVDCAIFNGNNKLKSFLK